MQADRFAREIIAILARSGAARSWRLMGQPLARMTKTHLTTGVFP